MSCVWKFAYNFKKIKQQKYNICKELEYNWIKAHDLESKYAQHLEEKNVKELDKKYDQPLDKEDTQNLKFKYKRGSQKCWYRLITSLFLSIWVGVIAVIWLSYFFPQIPIPESQHTFLEKTKPDE